MIRSLLPLIPIVLLMGAAMWKTRAEVLASREHSHAEIESRIEDRERADRLEAAWNPGHLVPMTEDVFGGVPDAEVRSTPVDPEIAQRAAVLPEPTIETSWPEGIFSHALGTPHGRTEPPNDWFGRHFSMVEAARSYRR